ncbi:hypothetical protein EFA69_16145 [Rufibacter immobilis]|uniref:Uncharacterized protein n=1 Tax=Rufibacter immobilis TaxID=1348778 RepID=A0A3M9MSF4_9BACT|nr:hypothetical protein [Rufibacter immobilis]RNI27648.1 hypothetical protein EFA69_16145 [Rufibacter immobilis]
MTLVVLEDLLFEEGTENMGGLVGEIYAAPASEVESITVAEDGVTATAIKMKAGKKMSRIYFTKDTGKVEDNEVGERDGGSFETTLGFFHPGNSAAVLKAKKKFNNGGFIFLAMDAQGQMRVVGSKLYPAYREAGSITTGGTPTERRGATFNFKAASNGPALIFTGTVPLEVAPAA